MPTTAELEQQVRTQYPAYAYLLTIPELRQLLLDAVNPDIGFSAQEFEARFQATAWYRSHSDSSRQWDAFLNADPASAEQQIRQRAAEISELVGSLGAAFPHEYVRHVADTAIRYGLNDAELRDYVMQFVPTTAPTTTPSGSLGTTYQEVRRLARSEWLVPMSDQDAWQWTRWIAEGNTTIEGYRATLADAARARFSHLSDQIDQGIPPSAYFAPYRQMIADELEINSEAVDLMDARWADILSYSDPSTPGPSVTGMRQEGEAPGERHNPQRRVAGGVRAMTMSEAQRFVRTQPEWERTSRARGMAAGLGNELLRTFGALA